MSTNKPLDKWEEALEQQVKILQECQLKYNVKSCSKCDMFLKCPTRKQYIKAVYESMNKGVSGGFEF